MAKARAATRLTRMGEWRTAQKMYQDQKWKKLYKYYISFADWPDQIIIDYCISWHIIFNYLYMKLANLKNHCLNFFISKD